MGPPSQTFYSTKVRVVRARDRAERLFHENVPLVFWVLQRIRLHHWRADEEDLIQAGMIGLLHAARRFDPRRKLRFSTYAYPCIHGYMRRLLTGTTGRRYLDLGVACTDDEEDLADAEVIDPVLLRRKTEPDDHRDEIAEAMRVVTPRERYVLRRRFGLGGLNRWTLVRLGKELGISQERVRQIERKAMGKVRWYLEAKRLREKAQAS